ncbi:MAG TPA: 50S ribosomal protein L25 [Patescibacteria group bacterium]|nr:50S ribosomal protein L25 [Patescibacteria group bacterium]
MSGQDIALVLEERKVLGKQVKHLRRDGMTPAVIHDHGQASKVVMAPSVDLLKVYHQAGKHHPLSLTLGKDTYMALIKDADFDPKRNQLRHIVFNAIKQDEKVETEVPIRLLGDIPAEKAGLMVITQLDSVDIEAYPKDLVDELTVDATGLVEIGDKIHVSDIVLPSGVEILTEAEHPIATVEETKAQMSEEEITGEAAEEGTEGEEGAEGAEGEASAEGESAQKTEEEK